MNNTQNDQLEYVISVARKQTPADLILKNARVINVFNGQVRTANVAISRGTIAGVGDYREAHEIRDLDGKYLAPGFINGHVHLESSMLDVFEYVRAVVPHGTLAVITDLHEIANVCGVTGLRYVLDSVRPLPLDVYLMAPSCVPATHLETSGAALDAEALSRILRWKQCIGLGEMMNYPGVLNLDKQVMSKLKLAAGRPIDGHVPGLTGDDLSAYIAAGIRSDHESVSLAEAREKLDKGMHIMIREGSSEKNLEELLPLVNDANYRRCMFVVDDRNCVDLLNDGDIDAVVRKAIRLGLDPVRAVQMATINPAEYFRLPGLGAISPGYRANMIVFDDINEPEIDQVYYHGQLVSEAGKSAFRSRKATPKLRDTVKIGPVNLDSFKLNHILPMPVIEVVPGQIITKRRDMMLTKVDGSIVSDINRDILKLAVVERHKASGNIGLGMVTGFGLKKGAIASSVSHDSHNIVAAGVDDESILKAVNAIQKLGGGLVAVNGSDIMAELALPIAGLLSETSLEMTVQRLHLLEQAARQLGSTLPSPFSVLSFLALPVIPELRLTDRGLVDVGEFRIID